MTDAAAVGTWEKAPKYNSLEDATSFKVWEKLSRFPGFGDPKPFTKNVFESTWNSFTITFRNKALFDKFVEFQRNEPGTGALTSFVDSNWFMSFVIPY